MYLDAAKKQEIFGKYGKSNTDTGSAEAQIALFSYRISHLTEHLKLLSLIHILSCSIASHSVIRMKLRQLNREMRRRLNS